MYKTLQRTLPQSRSLHASSTSRHLVGPNHPVSNFRPIIYTDTPTPAASHVNHPYSLDEFTDVSYDYTLELQYKLAREQLDTFNHNFWTDVRDDTPSLDPFVHSQLPQSNSRFETAKQSILASLPGSASPQTHENALSEFYKGWVMQERKRQDEYSAEWRKRHWDNVFLAARVEYQRLKQRIL
ncbi:hypothetical protein J3R83DRAFT_4745 [Lanmaoa asiatica]|nr:hypothetical protein J3R83DRAFT_4745 [Lanmaoa asiatica]